jgi:hypothetical protein
VDHEIYLHLKGTKANKYDATPSCESVVSKYVEYYHPDFAPYLTYFNNFTHLKELIEGPESQLDPLGNRKRVAEMYKEVGQQNLKAWKELFWGMGYKLVEQVELDW